MLDYKNIYLKKSGHFSSKSITLPASKSISNRALIVSALANDKSTIHNLSEARDTQTMQRLLISDEKVLDVIDAGTTMRFLTSYLAITNQHKTLTGSDRMQERPIKILVEVLTKLGAKINYMNNEGYPPLEIKGFNDTKANVLQIRGDVSSQYISSLLMIAPLLKEGLTLELTGKVGSKPYIEMTLSVMSSFGVQGSLDDNIIKIASQKYHGTEYTVEPDWSAASYWYSMVALSENSTVSIRDLKLPSIQGDSEIVKIMKSLGVHTEFTQQGATLTKTSFQSSFNFDFTHCPDLAQTVAVVCAAKGIEGTFTGLESLKIKETDRVKALQNELEKIGATLRESNDTWHLKPDSSYNWETIEIETYDDHRMAMAFAPLCMKGNVIIENPSVVMKSYPRFWEDLSSIGLTLSEAN